MQVFNCSKSIVYVNMSKCDVKVIPELCFYQSNVKKIKFPKTLEEIQKEAFTACAIEKLELPKTLVTIGEAAFWKCNLKC